MWCVMKIHSILLFFVLIFLPTRIDANIKVFAEYPSWATLNNNYHIHQLPVEKITHLIYNHANITEEGNISLGYAYYDIMNSYPGDSYQDVNYKGSFNQLRLMKESNPHLKSIIALGGWDHSQNYPKVAASAKKRKQFIQSALAFVKKYQFDGILIDWRYPGVKLYNIPDSGSEDYKNLAKLITELKEAIKTEAPNLSLSVIALPRTSALDKWLFDSIKDDIDYLILAAFELAGAWVPYSTHASPLYLVKSNHPKAGEEDSVDTLVQYFLNKGIPAQKLVVMISSAGRSWSGTTGLYKTAKSIPRGTFDSQDESIPPFGIYSREYVLDRLKDRDYKYKWDDKAKAAYLYSENKLGGHFISFEDALSIREKLNYIKANDLAGIGVLYAYAGEDIFTQIDYYLHPLLSLFRVVYQAALRNWLFLLISVLIVVSIVGWLFHFRLGEVVKSKEKELSKLDSSLENLQKISEQLKVEVSNSKLSEEEKKRLEQMTDYARAVVSNEIEADQVPTILEEIRKSTITNTQAKGEDQSELNSDSEQAENMGHDETMSNLVEQLQGELASLLKNPSLLSELYQVISNRQTLLYIKAEKGYSGIYMENEEKPIYVYCRLKQLLYYYGQDFLIRIHRSYLVNSDKMNSIVEKEPGKYVAYVGGVEIPIGGSYLKELQEQHTHWFR